MIASFHGNEEMQVVGEMMMTHIKRVDQLTDSYVASRAPYLAHFSSQP